MRAFVGQLENYDATYVAQYLTPEEIEEILESEWERGMVDEDGNPVAGGNMKGGRGQ